MSKPDQNEAESEQTGPIWKRYVNTIIETQIARHPILVQIRTVWRQIQDERGIWPYLTPLLALVFLGTYRAERRKLRNQVSSSSSARR